MWGYAVMVLFSFSALFTITFRFGIFIFTSVKTSSESLEGFWNNKPRSSSGITGQRTLRRFVGLPSTSSFRDFRLLGESGGVGKGGTMAFGKGHVIEEGKVSGATFSALGSFFFFPPE